MGQSLNSSNKKNYKIRDIYIKRFKMENIPNFVIPAIISTGFLLYRPALIESLIYIYLVILILYRLINNYFKKYNLHNLFSILSLGTTTALGLLYFTKGQILFLLLGSVYIVFSVYFFMDNIKEYTGLNINE